MKNVIMLSAALGFMLGAVAVEKCSTVTRFINKGKNMIKSKIDQAKDDASMQEMEG